MVAAAHAGPTLAVTVLSGLLGVAADLTPQRWALVVLAVFAGQLSIGWSNDLIDRGRDRASGRLDKPLATGQVPAAWIGVGCAGSLAACAALSLACGVLPALAHAAVVAGGWAYNLGLKSTLWSWLPYAVAFGSLPVFVSLAAVPGAMPPVWWPVGAALLGVGAHLLNVLPDLDEDSRTGVRGLPHRLGARLIPRWAVAVLAIATVVTLIGARPPWGIIAMAAGAVAALSVIALRARGRAPFLAGVGIALVDVTLLVVGR